MPGEDPQGPQFKTFPRSATVDRNGAASFSCEMEGPPKSVTWMKDGKELREVPMKTRLTSDKTRDGNSTISKAFGQFLGHFLDYFFIR